MLSNAEVFCGLWGVLVGLSVTIRKLIEAADVFCKQEANLYQTTYNLLKGRLLDLER